MTELYDHLHQASEYVSGVAGRHHRVAITLGSGLGGYADSLPDAVTIPYADIPHFPSPPLPVMAASSSRPCLATRAC